jgi:DNA-binding NtrC family response regulator
METIIVQETDEGVLDSLTFALREGGFNVYPLLRCEDDFLNMIEATRPHVVILDFRLKGDECLRVLHQIKAEYPHLPVIASSCNSNINQDYDKAGFDDYIPKPFDLDVLYQTLRKHIPILQ